MTERYGRGTNKGSDIPKNQKKWRISDKDIIKKKEIIRILVRDKNWDIIEIFETDE